jgi:peroxiredoxin family protein
MTEKKKRLALIASKGTLDMAYPPLILATTAAAMEMEAGIFFTLYGLNIINKHRYQGLEVAPVANPALPVQLPNVVGMLPGMGPMATRMMKSWFERAKVPSIPEFVQLALDSEVRLIGCQMTMEVMGVRKEDLIDGVEIGGAATFLDFAADAQIQLFI